MQSWMKSGQTFVMPGKATWLTHGGTVQVARLAMLTLLAVFKDILPGYRIRLPTEKELEVPVSKEVKQTRDYESMQVRLYQAS